jgi:hypothetical protein
MKRKLEHYQQALKLMEYSKTNAAALVRKAMRPDGDEVAAMMRDAHASISDVMERIEFRTRYGRVIKQFF